MKELSALVFAGLIFAAGFACGYGVGVQRDPQRGPQGIPGSDGRDGKDAISSEWFVMALDYKTDIDQRIAALEARKECKCEKPGVIVTNRPCPCGGKR